MVDIVAIDAPVPPADRMMLVGLRDTAGPAGLIDAARFTVPENPLRLVKLIVVEPEEPAMTVRLDGLALRLKSDCGTGLTITVIVIEWLSVPLVPVTANE